MERNSSSFRSLLTSPLYRLLDSIWSPPIIRLLDLECNNCDLLQSVFGIYYVKRMLKNERLAVYTGRVGEEQRGVWNIQTRNRKGKSIFMWWPDMPLSVVILLNLTSLYWCFLSRCQRQSKNLGKKTHSWRAKRRNRIFLFIELVEDIKQNRLSTLS